MDIYHHPATGSPGWTEPPLLIGIFIGHPLDGLGKYRETSFLARLYYRSIGLLSYGFVTNGHSGPSVCVCFLHELVVLYNVIHTCRFIHAPGVFGSLPPNLLFPTHGRDACATASATQVFLAWIAQGLDFKATSRTAQCRELCFGFGVSIGHWLRMWPIPPH